MTPNDIHADQTTSFVRIQQWKLQAVSRIVSEFFNTSRRLVSYLLSGYIMAFVI